MAGPALHEPDVVAGGDAHRGVPYALQPAMWPQERVAAPAGVLGQAVALADDVDPVPRQPAEVANALGEGTGRGVRIRLGREQQRVATARADVLVVAVAHGRALVGMVAKEAGERVSHAGRGSVPQQVPRAATQAAALWTLTIVYRVTDHRAREATPSHDIERTRC